MDLLCTQISTWMGSSQAAKLPGGKDTFPYLYFTQGEVWNEWTNEQLCFSQGRLWESSPGRAEKRLIWTQGQQDTSRYHQSGSLTHCLYLHVDEVLDVLLQGLMRLQGDGQVAIVFSVAEVHLDACGHKRGTKTANQKTLVWGFPGGSGEKNPPASAGDTGSIPGWGRSYMPRTTKCVHHNYWAHALEPGCRNYWSPHALEPVLCTKRSHHKDKPAHCKEEQTPLATMREKPEQQWRSSTAKNKQINKTQKKKVHFFILRWPLMKKRPDCLALKLNK